MISLYLYEIERLRNKEFGANTRSDVIDQTAG